MDLPWTRNSSLTGAVSAVCTPAGSEGEHVDGRSQEDGDALAALLAKGELRPVHLGSGTPADLVAARPTLTGQHLAAYIGT